MMERPRRQQRQHVHLQDCRVNLDDEVGDNGDLVHFAFLADSEPVRLANVIQHPKWQKAMNEELMSIEKNNIMTQIGFNLEIPIKINCICFHQIKRFVGHKGCSKSELREDVGY